MLDNCDDMSVQAFLLPFSLLLLSRPSSPSLHCYVCTTMTHPSCGGPILHPNLEHLLSEECGHRFGHPPPDVDWVEWAFCAKLTFRTGQKGMSVLVVALALVVLVLVLLVLVVLALVVLALIVLVLVIITLAMCVTVVAIIVTLV